jgi:hypothetical protein
VTWKKIVLTLLTLFALYVIFGFVIFGVGSGSGYDPGVTLLR